MFHRSICRDKIGNIVVCSKANGRQPIAKVEYPIFHGILSTWWNPIMKFATIGCKWCDTYIIRIIEKDIFNCWKSIEWFFARKSSFIRASERQIWQPDNRHICRMWYRLRPQFSPSPKTFSQWCKMSSIVYSVATL